ACVGLQNVPAAPPPRLAAGMPQSLARRDACRYVAAAILAASDRGFPAASFGNFGGGPATARRNLALTGTRPVVSFHTMFGNAIRRMPRPEEVARMTTQELRDVFLITGVYSA